MIQNQIKCKRANYTTKGKKMRNKISFVWLVILTIVGIITSGKQILAKECGINLVDLELKCLKFVEKKGPLKTPSNKCCNVVEAIDVQCLCMLEAENNLRSFSGKKISIRKVIYVAQRCGMTFSKGAKCGSKCNI